MTTIHFTLPNRCLPDQYVFRAAEAKKILSITAATPQEVASRICIAEIGQIIFFVAQTVIFSLAYAGIITPTSAGIASLCLIPLEALFSYHTFVHFKPFSRVFLTIAAVIALTACAIFALFGIVKDSVITLCAGGIALHAFRNISEFIDARNSKKNALYRAQVLDANLQGALY